MPSIRQDVRMPWILAGGALFVAIVFALNQSGRRRRRGRDLGVISDQWIAQDRASAHDPNRCVSFAPS
jgi:hypothetical protein